MASLSTQEQPATVNGKLDIHSKKAKTLKALEWCKKSVTALESYLGRGNVVEEYEVTAGELDNCVLELEKELSDVEEEIAEERMKLGGRQVFAEVEGEVGIALIYDTSAVYVASASWNLGYNIRVDMKTKEEQSTGEPHRILTDARTPTFGVSNLSISKPTPAIHVPPPAPAPVFSAGVVYLSASADFVRSNVSATFEFPGLITIPSDGVAHNITIEKIKNASQHTRLSGTGSVYFDGSFISRYEVPAVGPDESFDCPLGLDPSIRVTYHPQTKKQSKNGFYTKTTMHIFLQHITVFNTKTSPIEGDVRIQVNIINPLLTCPSVSSGSSSAEPSSSPVAVGKGITAAWEGAEDGDMDGERVGRDWKVGWVCLVPLLGKVILVLQWEVVASARTDLVGMMLVVCYP
ncbi:hypothetical protein FPV67DRAFT_1559215 [Lyophyllum atratum]|nr:hypothetical protein FPV67DRAFT_1559215 [Lyophyllum atratum]